MAGPVPTYLSTQIAAQTAFNVPFGLLALVNSAITTATTAGEFNTTVDCSLFTAEDVSNLRIYLDSLGYKVEFAKGGSEKGLLIDWGESVINRGDEVIVDQGTTPWIVSGSIMTSPNVNIHDSAGNPLTSTTGALNVEVANFPASQNVVVTNTPTVDVGNFPATTTVVQPLGSNLHVDIDNFPGSFSVTQGTSPWVVSGTVTANLGTVDGLALDVTLTSGSQKAQLVDGSGNVATVVPLSSTLTGSELGLVTNSLIYGKTTGGGGGYVEVKVNPSGALAVDASGSSVSVSNFPATQPVSGTVTVTQGTSPWAISGPVTEVNVDKNFGTWAYYAGISGTVTVTAGQRVIGLSAHSTAGGTVTINGGATITIPANVSFNLEPLGNVTAPTVVFTSTDTYFIEVVS